MSRLRPHWIRYLLSTPERLIRIGAAGAGGAAQETLRLGLPPFVRRSRLYEATAKNVLRIAVELVGGVEPDDPEPDAPDRLWGLSWRVANIEAAHARLKAANVAVSEIRHGRKPGTRVFTVKDNTLGVPTLMIGLTPKE